MLGPDFRWLWAQSTITNLGDGMLLAAGPLPVTTITREPFAVAMAVFLQQLPWVLFGMPAGAIIDRVDRRRLTILVNALRSMVLLGLAATVATGTANLAIVLGSVFLAPFWFAFFGSAILLALIWRTLAEIAHAPTADAAA